MKKFFKLKYILPAVLALVLISVTVVGVIFVNDYYPATDRAVEAMSSVDDGIYGPITVTELSDNATVFAPKTPTAGVILYPGGKVDHVAYAPLAQALARRGILCVLIEMPLRFAFLDSNAADGVIEAVEKTHKNISEWYIGGHSLGGAIAATYAEKHADEWDGLILLAAYSTADLSDSGIRTLSIRGSEDRILNREKYDQYRSNLPDGTVEETLPDGNHAGFGDYGPQDGDGTSTLPEGEQIEMTADLIAMFIHARTP